MTNQFKKYVKIEFDEFINSRKIYAINPFQFSKHPIKFNYRLVYIKNKNAETIAFGCHDESRDDFPDTDYIILNLDQENTKIEYKHSEFDHDENSRYESGTITLGMSLFEKICECKEFKFRVSGKYGDMDFSDKIAYDLQKYCQQFYNNAFDPNKYQKSIAEEVNSQSTSGGCFIATAAMGSYDDPVVMTLRRFRDLVLLPSAVGKHFVYNYYRISPPIATWLKNHQNICKLVKYSFVIPISWAANILIRAKNLFVNNAAGTE